MGKRALALFVSAGLGVEFLIPSFSCCAAPRETRAPEVSKPLRDPKWSLHFRAADVTEYFREALDVLPRRGDAGMTIFETGAGTNEENRYRIVVSQEERDVVVSFAVAGENGMNVVREFFEGPFFTRSESEQLYLLLLDAEKSSILALDRFSVGARAWQTSSRINIVLRFFRPDRRVTFQYGQLPRVRPSHTR